MNSQASNKPAEKGSPKTNTPKTATDQEKAINQLRQEIKILSKTVKEMQRKPDIQTVNIAIPQNLLSRANAYLLSATTSLTAFCARTPYDPYAILKHIFSSK